MKIKVKRVFDVFFDARPPKKNENFEPKDVLS